MCGGGGGVGARRGKAGRRQSAGALLVNLVLLLDCTDENNVDVTSQIAS